MRRRRAGTFALIAGGGTGGHVIPAIAIGRALVERGHPMASVHFVGSRRGMEGRLVTAAGFGITLLPGRGLVRRLSWDNIPALGGLVQAALQAVVLVARRRPAIVISVGGYASVSCVLAAALLRVPVVVAESNAVPGAANRLGARLAKASAVAFAGTPLPRAVVTGNPVRPEMLAVDRSPAGRGAARLALGLPVGRTVVLVSGGSLGARRINDAVIGLARDWAGRSTIALRHVVGERDWEAMVILAPELCPGGLLYQQVRFEDHMDVAYAAADLAVHRAGSGTVSELAAAGLPAVLVPLPGAPGDHQTKNATTLAAVGAAVVIPDADLTPERLGAELDRLLDEPGRLARMGAAARGAARPGAADAVAALAERYARA